MAEYYSPRAKTRWCLSLYDNVGHHSLGVFPQAAMVLFFLFYSFIHWLYCMAYIRNFMYFLFSV